MSADLSFLPEDYLEKKSQRRTNLISLGLSVVVTVAVVAAFVVTDRQRREVKELQGSVNGQFVTAAKRLDQLDQLQTRKNEMIRKAQVTSVLLERVPRTLVTSELVNSMPATVMLTELTLESKALRPKRTAATALEEAKKKAAAKTADKTGAKPGDEGAPLDLPKSEVTVVALGIAPTDLEVGTFIEGLRQCPLFEEVSLGFSEEMALGEQTLRKFRLEMKVNQDLDMTQYKPMKVARGLKMDPMANTLKMAPDGSLGTAPQPPGAGPRSPAPKIPAIPASQRPAGGR